MAESLVAPSSSFISEGRFPSSAHDLSSSTSLLATSSSLSCNTAMVRPANFSTVFKNRKRFEDLQNFEAYRKVKINRLLRLQTKRWQYRDLGEDATCPVCGEFVPASSPEELQLHVEECINKNEDDSEDDQIDVEGDEYEWCGLKKVRLTSLLRAQGQLEALGTRVERGDENENVEVCFVEEEESKFGVPQYSQDDLMQVSYNTRSENEHMEAETFGIPSESTIRGRAEVTTCSTAEQNDYNVLLLNKEGRDDALGKIETSPSRTMAHNVGTAYSLSSEDRASNNPVILKALEDKIKDLEERGSVICLICHGPYVTPLASITCWHVHCEKCWLQSLSTQKLCPQCKVIVAPTDLRKIFL